MIIYENIQDKFNDQYNIIIYITYVCCNSKLILIQDTNILLEKINNYLC